LQYKLRITRDQCVAQARDAIRLAKSFCEDVEFSPEDATRTEPDFLRRVLDAVVDAGATTLNIPDTVGYTVPTEFAELISMIRGRVRGVERVTISAHCHNDLGMAVANALAAVAAGARQVECTINGIGERAGNASLEEIVMAMRVRPDRYPYETGVVSEQIFAASQLLSDITGVPVQPNKAITGRNAFAHEAGIHQDGVLKNPLTYEIMTPKSVGVPDSKLVLGKHSGRHALSMRCEQLGYQFDRRALDDIYRRFVRLADKIKHVEDHHLLELIRDTHKPSGTATPLIEPLVEGSKAAVVNASAEPEKSFAAAAPTNLFGVPLPAPGEARHEQTQQEDYLWGV
jgi:2-isopropylmalate synthase